MKYRVGDKVKIKTWQDMKQKYGVDNDGRIHSSEGFYFVKQRERDINNHTSNRILTIKKIENNCYIMGKIGEMEGWYYWDDYMIECLVEEYERMKPAALSRESHPCNRPFAAIKDNISLLPVNRLSFVSYEEKSLQSRSREQQVHIFPPR